MVALLLAALALAGPIERKNEADALGWAETDLFQVLDVNATHAAIKVVFHHPGDGDEMLPFNCKYAGMEKWPGSGVNLGLVELATGKIAKFEVYATAWTPDECLSHDASAAALDAAKKAFLGAGLDIAKKPKPIAVEGSTFDVAGTSFTVKARQVTDTADPAFQALFPGEEGEGMQGVAEGALYVGDTPLFRSRRDYVRTMAGTGDISFSQAYQTDKGLVFVEVWHTFSGRGGDHRAYTLTPPLTVP